MISTLELRHIIECGFQPLSCTCTYNPAEHEDAPRQDIATATKLGDWSWLRRRELYVHR